MIELQAAFAEKAEIKFFFSEISDFDKFFTGFFGEMVI
jgi:hypothetical protein